jgi:hypothetical protein
MSFFLPEVEEMKRLVLLVAVLGFACLFTGTAFADIRNVPAEYSTIQAGIDAASSGDTVQVAPGTYHENITMKSGVVIQGAGQGVSIIDGGASGSVVTANSVDSAAKLDGFTITNGKNIEGGGMRNINSSSPTVSNCTFLENSAFFIIGIGNGGGMYNSASSPTVTDCTFSGNDASAYGGGMYNANSSPTVTNCTFSGNTVSPEGGVLQGGGMYNYQSSPTVTNCTFSGNDASGGAGMYNDQNSSPTVTNCTFSGNDASGMGGGGMLNLSTSSPTVVNSIFNNNMAPSHYGRDMYNSSSPTVTNCIFINTFYSMYNSGTASPIVTNCIFWFWGVGLDIIYNDSGASPVVTYCDIKWSTTVYPGTGNINADPMFVDPANGDFHLGQGSPCIDAGDNSAPSLPATDIDGDNRKIDDPTVADTGNGTPPIVDIGADEYVRKAKAMPWIPLLLFDE